MLAKQAAKDMAVIVKDWRKLARQLKIKSREIDYVSTAFEHDDLQDALLY